MKKILAMTVLVAILSSCMTTEEPLKTPASKTNTTQA